MYTFICTYIFLHVLYKCITQAPKNTIHVVLLYIYIYIIYIYMYIYICIYIYMYIYIYIYISLGALVPNSTDQHEKQW